MGWHDMAAAARALAWLQATGGGASPPPQEGAVAAGARAAVHWAHVRRYLRFALAAYGHLALKLFGVLPRKGGPASDEARSAASTYPHPGPHPDPEADGARPPAPTHWP